MLSPYVRFRLITEAEVCAAVLSQHSAEDADKFLQEVVWRSYWKGWLQLRPEAWTRYQVDLANCRQQCAENSGLRRAWQAAIAGNTGIDGFDDWAEELIETGYLHNHARMWFASIWIFTLGLPWQLGAAFFMRHLVDADAASNTLSWRWVAGLQTQGKTYAAAKSNIHSFTGGRFAPDGLARSAVALQEPSLPGPRVLAPLPDQVSEEGALLLTEEDYGIDSLPVRWRQLTGVAVACLSSDRVDEPLGDPAAAFAEGAARDVIASLPNIAPGAAILPEPLRRVTSSDLLPWLQKQGAKRLFVAEPPIGPAQQAVAKLGPALTAAGIDIVLFRRRWDALCWPQATHGFFRFKAAMPELLAEANASGFDLCAAT
jgi:deoxyribodipyrimidine photo-lyase